MSTWILLRGLTRETRHWGAFIETFQQHFPDAGVIGLDLPGNGRLRHLSSPSSVAATAEYCRAELRQQNIMPPYHLLAMSLGAMVAVAWAIRYPGEIQACVLINTSMRPFSAFYRRLRPQNYCTLWCLAFGRLSAEEREAEILRVTSNRSAAQRVLRDWVAYRRECPVSTDNALRQLLAAARYRAPRLKPATRILVLTSSQDALVAPQCSRQLATAWQLELAEHPTAGHDIPLDDGVWVAQQVLNWL